MHNKKRVSPSFYFVFVFCLLLVAACLLPPACCRLLFCYLLVLIQRLLRLLDLIRQRIVDALPRAHLASLDRVPHTVLRVAQVGLSLVIPRPHVARRGSLPLRLRLRTRLRLQGSLLRHQFLGLHGRGDRSRRRRHRLRSGRGRHLRLLLSILHLERLEDLLVFTRARLHRPEVLGIGHRLLRRHALSSRFMDVKAITEDRGRHLDNTLLLMDEERLPSILAGIRLRIRHPRIVLHQMRGRGALHLGLLVLLGLLGLLGLFDRLLGLDLQLRRDRLHRNGQRLHHLHEADGIHSLHIREDEQVLLIGGHSCFCLCLRLLACLLCALVFLGDGFLYGGLVLSILWGHFVSPYPSPLE
jgi:hypothetical protein